MKKYGHYVALEWAKANMAIARMSGMSEKVNTIDVPSDIDDLKLYLKRLGGSKILTFEETTTSQWLYTELRSYVDDIIICDPRRNKLLSDGAKNDIADAKKLVTLLRNGLLKEVYHSSDRFIRLRKIVSGYDDLIKSGVRLKNQRDSFLRSVGKSTEKDINDRELKFVLDGIDRAINNYEADKKRYEAMFKLLNKTNPEIRNQESISGIGYINSVKIISRVVDAERFKEKGDYFLYCGLLKYDKISGGRSYGKRTPRYSRQLKCVYKTAANAVLGGAGGNNYFYKYYEHLIKVRGFPEYQARHALARKIAAVSYGIMRNGEKFNPIRRDNDLTTDL
ncbi:MAG: transposase [Pseudomonadota bacterium]